MKELKIIKWWHKAEIERLKKEIEDLKEEIKILKIINGEYAILLDREIKK